MLANSGYSEWCVLKTIGHVLLSSQGKKRLAELERKFSAEQVPTPHDDEVELVGSPIRSYATHKMTDDHWLSAINKDWSQNAKSEFRKGNIVGGAFELAGELEGCTKSDPARFARFFLRLPASANSIYGRAVLQGLAGAEQVDANAAIAVLRMAHAHADRPFGLQIARLVRRHPACAAADDVCEALLWYAEHGEASEKLLFGREKHPERFPSIHDLVPPNPPLVINGMNSVRGVAWQALAQAVESNPHCTAVIWAPIERRAVEEPLAAVRTMMLHTLAPLFGPDTVRFSKCLRLLTEPLNGKRDEVSALAPLATRPGVHLFRYIERDLPDHALELMRRMIASPDSKQRLIGVWWALAERLRQGNSREQFPDIERQSAAHTKLWASILCDFVAHTEFRHMAISELEELFFHGLPEVRKAAAAVFRHIPGGEFPHFMDMARAFVRSPAFLDSPSMIFEALEKTPCDVTDLVIESGEILVENRHEEWVPYEIQTLLKREYVNSEARPDLRARFLDLIDSMAANNLVGADDLMRVDDR